MAAALAPRASSCCLRLGCGPRAPCVRVPPAPRAQQPTCRRAQASTRAQSTHGRRPHVAARSAAEGQAEPELEPETAQEANDAGLRLTGAAKWAEALTLFEKAMTLPGTGIKRFRDKPRPASDREKMTSLFNIACCHSQLGDTRSGLVALAGCLELGYADFRQIRADPDLATLRKDERFEGLMQRFEPQQGSLLDGFGLGSLFGKK